jgi:alkanesulfonate monooxygenase SsuD/methylene tetrahydromethanopterin reductase-like flavin-dependent oxidoreductase (luciferase family)
VGLPTLGERGTSGGDLDVAAAARHVEALGLDSVTAADLIIGDGTPGLEVTVALAAAAAATERVGIGFGIGAVGEDWMRQCDLVAEARAMLA